MRWPIAQRDAYREFRDYVADLVTAAGIDNDDPRTTAERLIAGADGLAVQALFDPGSWPPPRQLQALDTLLAAESH